MAKYFSRREFLKISGSLILGSFLPPFMHLPPKDDPFPLRTSSYWLGRAVRSGFFYAEPSFDSEANRSYNTNTVLKIYEEKLGQAVPNTNPHWLNTEKGWVNAAFIQPVRNVKNQPVVDVPAGGFLAEVTVPQTWAWQSEDNDMKQKYAMNYGTTWWVDFCTLDKKTGVYWYRIFDDLEERYYWCPAQDLRQITAEEVAPLSPDVKDKRIEISLSKQTLTAFEYGKPVFTTLISTGAQEGDTKTGEYIIERKRPSRRMAANEGNGYDLPGVPWVCYISWTGVSIHGTYWHNNFGHPMSHGCINLPTPSAKWIFRWTDPIVPFGVQHVKADGTPVIIYE